MKKGIIMHYIPSYDHTRVGKLDTSGKSFVLPYGDYKRIDAVCVKPANDVMTKKLTIAYVTTRRRDAHKELYVCGTDGKIHKYAGKVPQNKHVKIPHLMKLLGLQLDSSSWDISLYRVM